MVITGKLITIEGVDGAGKTTLAAALIDSLSARGVEARLMREPGGVETSERIRELVKDPALVVGDRTEALLYAAARAQLVEQALRPALLAGEWIVLDRFVDSSLAYQGAGRGLGIDEVAALNEFGTGGLRPHRTLLLMLDADAALARTGGRGDAPDRLEQAGRDFFNRVRGGYMELAEREPERIRVIDASQSPDEVLRASLEALKDMLPEWYPW